MFQPTRPFVRWSSVEIRRAKGVGMFERQRGRQPEAQMLRRVRHGRHQLQRVVDGNLGGMPERRLYIAVQHVIDAEHIGNEQPVELAAFKRLCQMHPVVEILVTRRLVARMRPKPWRLMADTVHVEGIQPDFAAHIRHLVESCNTSSGDRCRPSGVRAASGQGSERAVLRWRDAVQVVVADDVILPAHRIMQRVGAGVAPVAVEVESDAGGRRAGEFEERVGGFERDFCCQHLGGGDRQRRLDDAFLGAVDLGDVDLLAGTLDDGGRRLKADRELSDAGDCQWIVRCPSRRRYPSRAVPGCARSRASRRRRRARCRDRCRRG